MSKPKYRIDLGRIYKWMIILIYLY
jgi:hypothetical protein